MEIAAPGIQSRIAYFCMILCALPESSAAAIHIWGSLISTVSAGEADRVKELEARLADLQQTVLLGCMERTALQQQLSDFGGEQHFHSTVSMLLTCKQTSCISILLSAHIMSPDHALNRQIARIANDTKRSLCVSATNCCEHLVHLKCRWSQSNLSSAGWL